MNKTNHTEEATVRAYFENLPVMAYKISLQGTIIDCNTKVTEQLGYNNKDELLGKPLVQTIYAPSCHKRAIQLFEQWKLEGEIHGEELKVISRFNHEIDVLLNVRTICDNDGRPLHSLSTHMDITDRKRMEKALRVSEETYRALYENASDGILLLDDNGVILHGNSRFAEMLGYPREQIMGIKAADLIHPEDLAKSPLQCDTALLENAFIAEQRMRHNNKAYLSLEVSAKRIATNRIQYICRDVTERLEMERALVEKEKALEYQAHHLQEANAALRALLTHWRDEKQDLEKSIVRNINSLVLPHLDKLETEIHDQRCLAYLEIIKSNLKSLASPLTNRLSERHLSLSPTELKVADLVKQKKTSKEIAELLDVSTGAILFHRKNIRKKMGIKNQKRNLLTCLQSLDRRG